MPVVHIDGVEYVPRSEIQPLDDERLLACLEVLTEMRYFNEKHKMMRLAYNALHALSPELAEMTPEAAYDRVRSYRKQENTSDD